MISSFNVPTLTPHLSPLPLSKGEANETCTFQLTINGDYPPDQASRAY
jgi:hypothetical protein